MIITMIHHLALLSSLCIVSHVAGFIPAPRPPFQRHGPSSPVKTNQMFNPDNAGAAPKLEVVEGDEDDGGDASAELDPFDSYRPVAGQVDVATKDVRIGAGAEVLPTGDQMIQVKFKTNLIDGKYNKQIREFDISKLGIKMGASQVMPGLEEGVRGMRAGGVRGMRAG